jgi:hypothetical protein
VVSDVGESVRDLGSPLRFMLRRSSLVEVSSSRISRNFPLDNFLTYLKCVYANLESTEISRKIPKYNCNIRECTRLRITFALYVKKIFIS